MALRDAQCSASDVDLIIVATTTPDYTFPSVATQVQAMLGMQNAAALALPECGTGFVIFLLFGDCALILVSEKGMWRGHPMSRPQKKGAAEHKLENAYAGVRPVV